MTIKFLSFFILSMALCITNSHASDRNKKNLHPQELLHETYNVKIDESEEKDSTNCYLECFKDLLSCPHECYMGIRTFPSECDRAHQNYIKIERNAQLCCCCLPIIACLCVIGCAIQTHETACSYHDSLEKYLETTASSYCCIINPQISNPEE
ncbi:hypothetical protein FJ364_00170 [Candidatus Dependentiae bacterium]|nr:hypothetical protein [Candidatus Dependentiae bacterium]